MKHVTKRATGPILFAAILICFGYISAQQKPTQQQGRAQSATSQPPQQNEQLRDQVAELQKQVQDLQAAIDDLRAQQQVIEASAKESHDLVLDNRIEQKRGREAMDSLARTVNQEGRQIDQLGRQINSIMRDLSRVKTKVGLF